MDEQDLYKLLSESHFKKVAAVDFLKRLKEKSAGAKEMFDQAKMFANNNKANIIGAVGGGALAAGMQYHGSKSGKAREDREKALAESTKKVDEAKAQGKELGFKDDMERALRTGGLEVSKVQEKHPKRGALFVVPAGVGAGMFISNLVKKIVS